MATFTQEERPLEVQTPLGKDTLLLRSFSGEEEVSRLFQYELEFLSEKDDIAADQIVGKPITFSVKLTGGEPRHFNGLVRRFAYCGTDDRQSRYRATVVPWLWMLTRTSDCKTFQDKSVPDIIEEVFGDLGMKDFDKSGITQTHPKWEYCVQYRETDFNFLSRLMEQEGIFYYFKHEDGKHTLCLADSVSGYYPCDDAEVEFEATLAAGRLNDQIQAWEHEYDFRSGKWVHTDYNFKKPSTSLLSDTKGKLPLSESAKYEFFDFPGEYEEKGDGQSDVKLRQEQEEAGYDVVQGRSRCWAFSPGAKFKMAKHHAASESGKGYVITGVRHEASVGESYSDQGGGGGGPVYRNGFSAIPDKAVFRPQRRTPKPLVHGVQTALVVGPSGEEIYVDEFGRVKVQFFWDRLGKKDEKSSCWIRCAQSIAGKGWGSMFLPRIGQEVVVTYLEGDPDRPLITGLVYNGTQKPPYTLPDEKTKTYFKSNSTKGGSGFNEIRFEDKADKEQIFFHAQKDMDVRILNDRREIVLGKQHLIVGGGDDGGETREQVEKDRHITVKGNKEEKIEKDSKLLVTGEQHVVVNKTKSEKVDQDVNLTVGGALNEKVATKHSLEAQSIHAKSGGDLAFEAQTIHIKAGMALVLEAGLQVSLKVGGNFVDVSVAGVAINGMPVLINSGGAAGSGSGCSPTAPQAPQQAAPKEPDKADDAKTGQKSAP
jgi:type VI secretion system secreted protein VgrG